MNSSTLFLLLLLCLTIIATCHFVSGSNPNCDSGKASSNNFRGKTTVVLHYEDEEVLNTLTLRKKNMGGSVRSSQPAAPRRNVEGPRSNNNIINRIIASTSSIAKKVQEVSNRVSSSNNNNRVVREEAGRSEKKVSSISSRARARPISQKVKQVPTERQSIKLTHVIAEPEKKLTANQIVANSLPKYDGNVGPTNERKEDRKPFTSGKRGALREYLDDQDGAPGTPAERACVACRVDCLKEYSKVGGSMFSSCAQRYYYYGCKFIKPCFDTKTSTDDEILGMVGVCAYRNGCNFKSEWKAVSDNQIIADRLVGRIRASDESSTD